MGGLFAVAKEIRGRFTEIGLEAFQVVALEDVGAGSLAVADTFEAFVGGVFNAGVPVVVRWKEDIPGASVSVSANWICLEKGGERAGEFHRSFPSKGIVVLHNHDRLPFWMFFHKLQTFDVAHGTAEGAIGVLNSVNAVDFFRGDGHTLELGL